MATAPEHLLGAFGGGEVGCHLRVLGADKPHPAGAAGGKLGQLPGPRLGEALHKLAALLHDGQVGGEGGVKHVPDPQGADGGGQAALRGLLRGQAQDLSPSGPDGGGDLEDHLLGGVCQGGKDGLGVVPLPQGAHGTVGHALAAQGAVGLVHPQAPRMRTVVWAPEPVTSHTPGTAPARTRRRTGDI